jgi:hypothetical protein
MGTTFSNAFSLTRLLQTHRVQHAQPAYYAISLDSADRVPVPLVPAGGRRFAARTIACEPMRERARRRARSGL